MVSKTLTGSCDLYLFSNKLSQHGVIYLHQNRQGQLLSSHQHSCPPGHRGREANDPTAQAFGTVENLTIGGHQMTSLPLSSLCFCYTAKYFYIVLLPCQRLTMSLISDLCWLSVDTLNQRPTQ